MPSKKVAAIVKIAIPAGSATPRLRRHRLGPHGVQHGVRQGLQRRTASAEPSSAEITIYEDRSFTFIKTRRPPS